jgi:streptogramin lyase
MALALASSACSDSPEGAHRGETAAPTSAAVGSTLEDRLEAQIAVGDQPDWILADFGSVWVARDEAAAVDRIDPETNEVVSTIEVGPHPCDGLASGFGAIWVPSCTAQKLYRISASNEQVEATIVIPLFQGVAGTGPFGGLATDEEAVWMMTQGRSGVFDALARIDPRTNKITDTIPLGHLGGGVAVGDGAVWVTAPEDGLLLRVDPASREVVDQVEGLAQPSWVATGEGGVWVLSGVWSDHQEGDGSVVRVDPETGEIVAGIKLDESPGQAGYITVGEGLVWARTQFTLLAGIDPDTNAVVDRITDQKGLGGVTVGHGSIWLSDFAFNAVWRVTTTP